MIIDPATNKHILRIGYVDTDYPDGVVREMLRIMCVDEAVLVREVAEGSPGKDIATDVIGRVILDIKGNIIRRCYSIECAV